MKTTERAPIVEVIPGKPSRFADGVVRQPFFLKLESVTLDCIWSMEGADLAANRLRRALRGFRKPCRRKAPQP